MTKCEPTIDRCDPIDKEPSEPVQINRYLIPAVYLLLVVAGIPWYLPPGLTTMVLGFPLWAFISLCVGFIGAGFTAWLYLAGRPDEDD